MRDRFQALAVGAFLILFSGLAIQSAEVDGTKLPRPVPGPVDFARQIQPIFERTCFRCHGPEKPKSKFRLDNQEAALKGGENGVAIIPGKSAESPLIHYVARLVADMEMPPEGKGDPLTSEEIGLLRSWIDQGASWNVTPRKPFEFSVVAGLKSIWISGVKGLFREHHRNRGGTIGGFQEFSLKEQLTPQTTFAADGRLLFGEGETALRLSLDKKEVGFIHAGFEQYRKYYDDSGGYFGQFNPPAFSLDRDLHLDSGRAWIDLGLTIPNWPQIVVGYEYQFREGERSTLQWGPVSSGTNLVNIFPAFQEVDQKVHIVKVDLSHQIKGFSFEDSFRGEFYDLATDRRNVAAFHLSKPGPDKLVRTREGHEHFQGMNAFKVEKQVRPWWLVSGGYLYSYLDGEGSFQQNTVLTPNALLPPVTPFFGDDKFWFSQRILLEQESHIFNLNSRLGPWEGLTFTSGAQAEWQRQKGFGTLRLDEGDPTGPLGSFWEHPTLVTSDIDKFTSEENFGLRFTSIPYTVLFAETRFQQESLGQFESQLDQSTTGGFYDFLRDTDVTSDLKEYRAGFAVSPWSILALSAHYKHREKESNYEHLRDVIPTALGPFPNRGYSAFIRWRNLETDAIEAKLTLKWPAWLKSTLIYKRVATDYLTRTDPVIIPILPPVVISPGGNLLAGQNDSDIYSVNFTLTPLGRLYLSSTFSYQRDSTDTSHENSAAILRYHGDTYSILESATYALNDSTDLFASYSYSRADYHKDKQSEGLNLGLFYDWHTVQAGIAKRLNKNFQATVQYAFFTYSEPTFRGLRNYAAHGLFATLGMNWP